MSPRGGSLNQIEFLLKKHRGGNILLDTNVLLLYVVGRHDRDLISRFKRTNNFVPEDFDSIETLISNFSTISTTPSILTEVSNYCGDLESKHREGCLDSLRDLVLTAKERRYESKLVCQDPGFIRFELTDTTILRASRNGDLVLTTDLPLHAELLRHSRPTINFNNLRPLGWS